MKLQHPFLQLPLSFDAAALAAEVGAIAESDWRPHPQGYPGNDALTLITTGGDPESDAVAGPMLPTRHLERCPYLQQVLHSIGATWGRTRLMRLSGQAEVTPHVDVNYYWRERVRVHVPIVTQPTVRFSCGDAEINMRAGECWLFDTWRMHNVVNDHSLPRIHLVADTVGGIGFWRLVARARPHTRIGTDWQATFVAPDPQSRPSLDFESENVPDVMTPWEVRAHVAFALAETPQHRNMPPIQQRLLTFVRDWHGLWSAYGERQEGWPRYRALLDAGRRDLVALGASDVALANTIGLMAALDGWVFNVALADRRSSADPEVRQRVGTAQPAPAGDPVFDRPVFIVSPPRSGSTMLFETLARAPGVFTIGDESHQLIEGVPQLSPESRDFESNRLLAADATPAMTETLRRRFYEALRDREGSGPQPGQLVRMLEKTPKNSLRVPFLTRVFPQARFIYLYRDPRQVLSSMIEAWTTGRFRTYPQLPGWTGAPWSLLLVPGWRELIGRPLHEIVATQWNTATRLLLDDLEALPADRITIVRYDTLVADPAAEIRRLCAATGLDWDEPALALRLSKYTVSPPSADKWRRHAAEIEAVLPSLADKWRRHAAEIEAVLPSL
ncbi:MAG TPA: sulfotransferase, partial [Steroidobacteraceae bacterium]|nr:sulfotransferase [Steroidobacteraceae bacterium]